MKTVPQLTLEQAAALVLDGAVLMAGGFGMTGNPVHLLNALAERDTKNLTYMGNNVGEPGLAAAGCCATASSEGDRFVLPPTPRSQGVPGGTWRSNCSHRNAGRVHPRRWGGHCRLLHTRRVGTIVAENAEVRTFDGEDTFRAWPARQRGLRPCLAGRHSRQPGLSNDQAQLNPLMAIAADLVIVEVEEIVAEGVIAPDQVHTPGCFVDYLVQAHTTLPDLGSSASVEASGKKADESGWRWRPALAELHAGDVVGQGVGIPTLVADLITPEHGITLHTENGMLGVGPAPEVGGAMDYPVNAGKQPVTALPGASYQQRGVVWHDPRRARQRGDHGWLAGRQGRQPGQLGRAGQPLLGIGGAMDLASGAGG